MQGLQAEAAPRAGTSLSRPGAAPRPGRPGTLSYYTILYYTILYYTILYYTILYYNNILI